MDPIVEKPKKSKKKLFIGIGAILALLLIGGGGYGYWWWMKTEPERDFYSVLDTMMSTRYLERQYIISHQSKNFVITIDAQNDFKDLAQPTSKISYSYVQKASADKQSTQLEIAGDIITLKAKKISARLTKGDTKASDGKWANFSEADVAAMAEYDPFKAQGFINTYLDIIPMGGLGGGQKATVLDYMKSQGVYSVTAKEGVDSGNKGSVYTVKTSGENLEKLSTFMAKTLNTNVASIAENKAISSFKVWTNGVGRITKITLPLTTDSGTGSCEISVSYPSSVSIEEPL